MNRGRFFEERLLSSSPRPGSWCSPRSSDGGHLLSALPPPGHRRILREGEVDSEIEPWPPRSQVTGCHSGQAYNCSKELFGVMFSDYQLFSSGFLPLLAFGEGMLKDLAATDQSRQRAFVSQLSRSRILDAWDANKRHMRAVSSLKRQSDFGIRKEVTLRLDVILAMWVGGRLEPNQSPIRAQCAGKFLSLLLLLLLLLCHHLRHRLPLPSSERSSIGLSG
ncbi:hypothetical protein FocnCong_v021607 [Fusarium oxysporum f. sp. conglutinans]|nr:hypothetical protein FocnCong_v021424 [Fusarium oxysporum f. sp. conglutinans]KAG6978062.1 hypothetical protein FocnCong_v021607 [Fusarium oxysporum f. sp. conglutinans]